MSRLHLQPLARRMGWFAAVATVLLCLTAAPALAGRDDDIPGVPIGPGTTTGVVDGTTDPQDVYAVKLFDGEEVRFALSCSNPNYYVKFQLLAPSVKSIHDSYSSLLYFDTFGGTAKERGYTPAKDGVYHIMISTGGKGVPYTLVIKGSAELPPNPAYLRLRTSATKVKKGRSVKLTARLVDTESAVIPGMKVGLFRSYNGRSWTKVKTLSSTSGSYSVRQRITRKTWFRMRYAGNATWSACVSRKIVVHVR